MVFKVRQRLVPPTGQRLSQRVRSALKRGLPPVELGEHGPFLYVVANGPSAQQFDFERCAIRHHEPPCDSLAINGALKQFTRRGLAPTYWIACDPQRDQVMAFLDEDLPRETTYLVASKCHPDVFERLRDRRVQLWHVSDASTRKLVEPHRPIPTATSVTVCAIELMWREGYTHQQTWGWDGCFIGGRHHATDQPHAAEAIMLGVGGKVVMTEQNGEGVTGGEWFETTGTWAGEAKDALLLGHLARQCGVTIDVRGGGMFAAMLRAQANGPAAA